MSTGEMETIRRIINRGVRSPDDTNTLFNAYHGLGHKHPKDRSCPSCVLAVVKFFKAYLEDERQGTD